MQPILRHKSLAVLVCIFILFGVWYIGFASKTNQDSLISTTPTSTPDLLDTLSDLHDQAHALIQAGDYAGALEKANLATELGPLYPDAWVDKGYALYRLGQCKESTLAYYHAGILLPQSDENLEGLMDLTSDTCKEGVKNTDGGP